MRQSGQHDRAPLVVVDTTNLAREDWLEYRRTGIGGSDAAAVLGVSQFMTCRDLYYDKLKIASVIDDDSNWVAKEVGHLLEDLVAKIFHVKTGYRIYQVKKMFRHPDHSFMLADVDYFIDLPDGTTALLEIKTTNYHMKDRWWDEKAEIVPLHYELQGRHYMAVMNVNRVYYCCLYGNSENEVIIRHIDRDLDFESELIALEEDFWHNHVVAHVPPSYTEDGDMVLDSVRRHFGVTNLNAAEVTLNSGLAESVEAYHDLQEAKRQLDRRINLLESEMNKIKGMIAAEMGANCLASCTVNGIVYSVSFSPMSKYGINKDNLFRLRERHPDVYNEFVTVSDSRRFTIKVKTKDAA